MLSIESEICYRTIKYTVCRRVCVHLSATKLYRLGQWRCSSYINKLPHLRNLTTFLLKVVMVCWFLMMGRKGSEPMTQPPMASNTLRAGFFCFSATVLAYRPEPHGVRHSSVSVLGCQSPQSFIASHTLGMWHNTTGASGCQSCHHSSFIANHNVTIDNYSVPVDPQ